jgi:hypothetical protein
MASGRISASPNPVSARSHSSLASTILSWESEGTTDIEIRVGAPDGPLLVRAGPHGCVSTGRSTRHGALFFLQDVSDGAHAGTLSTLGTVSVRHELPATDRIRDRIPIGEVDFGDLDGLAPVSADWGFDRGQPVDRYYIERFLQQHAGDIRGHVLEIGDDSYTRRFGGGRVSRSDVLNFDAGVPGTTIAGDLAHLPQIPAGTFDCVVLTQTLQLIYDVEAAVRTIHRILRPGGVLLATFPGITHTKDAQWGRLLVLEFHAGVGQAAFRNGLQPRGPARRGARQRPGGRRISRRSRSRRSGWP